MVHLHFPRYPSPTVFPPHLEIQYSCDLTAWQQHITVLYNDCVSAQSFWHLSRNPFKSSGPYLWVWPYSKLGPNPLPLLPPSIYSTLLKDQIRSPQFRSVVSHFLPSPSCRIWAFTSSSGVKKREHLLWDPWVWSCWSSTYHGQQGASWGPAVSRASLSVLLHLSIRHLSCSHPSYSFSGEKREMQRMKAKRRS